MQELPPWPMPPSYLVPASSDDGNIKLCCVCGVITKNWLYKHEKIELFSDDSEGIPVCFTHYLQFPDVDKAGLKRMVFESREQFISVIKFGAAQTSALIVNAEGPEFIHRARIDNLYCCYHPNCPVSFTTMEHMLRHENNYMRNQQRRIKKSSIYKAHYSPWKCTSRDVYYSDYYLNCIVETIGTAAASRFFPLPNRESEKSPKQIKK